MPNLVKVAVLLQKENAFLLVQEKAIRVHGLWNWPQGTVENGETLEDAAVREVREETGLQVRLVRKLAVLSKTFPDTKELYVYLGLTNEDAFKLQKDEIFDANYFTAEQIKAVKDQLVGDWVYDVISEYAQ